MRDAYGSRLSRMSRTVTGSMKVSLSSTLLTTKKNSRHSREMGGRMTDLSTTYMGLQLRTPLVASASPLSHELDGIRRLEDAGASAIVLYSLFEEQIRQDEREIEFYLHAGSESYAESLTYFPMPVDFRLGPQGYLNHILRAKDAVH